MMRDQVKDVMDSLFELVLAIKWFSWFIRDLGWLEAHVWTIGWDYGLNTPSRKMMDLGSEKTQAVCLIRCNSLSTSILVQILGN